MRSPRCGRGLFFLTIISIAISIADGGELTCQLYFILFEGVRWFWGLTCDFWAENAERNFEGQKTEAKAIDLVASPFGLRSCLRQSGRAASLLAGRGAESPALSQRQKQRQKQKQRQRQKQRQ